jgi:hypothetical protein
MQIPIMAGVTAESGSLAASYPINMEPRAFDSGVSRGQLVTTRGAVLMGTGPGPDRGGFAWNGVLYRVMGSKLCRIASDGALTEIGDVGTDTYMASFDASFDRLAVRSSGRLFYYDGTTLAEVTDSDIGQVLDVAWMDGYFVTTDGDYVVVTKLLDPASVDPLQYGNPEEDPDPVTGVMKFREELLAFGRYTIQPFSNVGGIVFPFSPVQGATIPYGCIAPTAKCKLGDVFAFVGGGKNEPLGLFIGDIGGAKRISTREVEALIAVEPNPELIQLEMRAFEGEKHVLMHLTDQTIGLSLNTSAEAEEPVWFVLRSGDAPCRRRNAILCYGQHWIGDSQSGKYGILADNGQCFGSAIPWQFDAALMFSNGRGFLATEIELFGQTPTTGSSVFLSMTRDGVAWTREMARRLDGQRDTRLIWRPGARVPTLAGFRFRGEGRAAFSRAEMQGEAL